MPFARPAAVDGRALARLLLGLLLIPAASGRADPERPEAPAAQVSVDRLERLRAALDPAEGVPPARALLVRLAFEAGADLDLFVTGPLQETVYFGNSPSRSGGRLARDFRCGDPAPRVERVLFDAPLAGRYRIGVDFHRRCPGEEPDGADAVAVPYVLRIDGPGVSQTLEGVAAPGHFDAVVHEFELGAGGAAPRAPNAPPGR